MKRTRILAAALALTLTAGCAQESAPALPETAEPIARVAYVPLDDRPVNLDRVVYLGEAMGYQMELPEEDLFHTALDQQQPNNNGSRCGDRGALLQWVLEQEEAGCDRYILSLDQLLSGGLVSSRSFSGGEITLPDGRMFSEQEGVDLLLETLADPENQVYLLDTVMRLAPTVGYEGWDLAGYELLRAYGMEARPALTGTDLTPECIAAHYGMASDGTALEAAEFQLTGEQVETYHRARSRKLALSAHALEASEGMENIHFLIGVDDSAPSASIQTSEIAFLKQQVSGRGAVLSGADEDGMLAVCRMYADLDADTLPPSAWVRYFGGSEHNASSDFDHQPMMEIVEAHLAYLGMEARENAEADLQVLVLTAPAGDPKTAIREILTALEENAAAGVPTILMDAAKNAYGPEFQKQLVKKAELGMLLGYAGFYDLANVTGIALSCGAARWMVLAHGGERNEVREAAFRRTLADSLLKDLCYKNDVKVVMAQWIRQDLQGDPDNFAKTGTDGDAVLVKLESEMDRGVRDVVRNLERSNFLTDLEGTLAGWGSVELSGFAYPWQRVFEVQMELAMGPERAPHGGWLR